MIMYAVYGVIGGLAAFGALLGLARGLFRQTFRLVTIGASALVAFIATRSVMPEVVAYLNETPLEELIASAGVPLEQGITELIGSFGNEIATYVLALPIALIVAPLIFILAFVAVSAVAWLFHKIICGIFGFTRKNNNFITRIFGAGVGAVQGAAVALILLMPVFGLLNVAEVAVTDIKENHPDSAYTEVISAAYDEAFGELNNSSIYKVAAAFPITVYKSYQEIDINGHKINTLDVVTTAANIYVQIGDLDGSDLASLTAEDKAVIDGILETVEEDYYTRVLVSGALHVVAYTIDTGELDISFEGADAQIETLISDIIKILATSSPETIPEDLETFKQVYYLLSDAGILSLEGDLFEAFLATDENGQTIMSRLNNALVSNPRTLVICKDLAEVAMTIVLSSTGFDEVVAPETVENVKNTLNEVISIKKEDYATEEEYKSDVQNKIDESLKENDIALEPEQVEKITDFVIEQFEGKEEVSDADMMNFMSEYYNVYVEMLNKGEEVPEIPEIPGVDLDNLPDLGGLGGLGGNGGSDGE